MEKIGPISGLEKRVKSCHVSGCHGFFGPDLRKLHAIGSKIATLQHLMFEQLVRCVIAQAFCSQKSFRKITLNYAKLH